MFENNILYFYTATGVITLLLIIWVLSIEFRLKKFFKGKKAQDLESVLNDLNNDLKKLDVSKNEIEKYLQTVERRLKISIQHVGILRFNPYELSGSNQSFAIAFLNENGDGVVISSLYSREGVRTYAKPIKKYASEYALSDEENEAIKKAKTNE